MEQINTNSSANTSNCRGTAADVRNFNAAKLQKEEQLVEQSDNGPRVRRYSSADLIAQYYQQA